MKQGSQSSTYLKYVHKKRENKIGIPSYKVGLEQDMIFVPLTSVEILFS